MRLFRSQPLADHVWRTQNAKLNEGNLWDQRLSAVASSGALLSRPPTDLRLEGLEAQGPWGREVTNAWLFSHGVAAGSDNARVLGCDHVSSGSHNSSGRRLDNSARH